MTDLCGFSRYMELMRERLTSCISANGVQCNPLRIAHHQAAHSREDLGKLSGRNSNRAKWAKQQKCETRAGLACLIGFSVNCLLFPPS
jgi:hypothetical protein